MVAAAKSGPEFIFGNLSAIPAAMTGSPVPDPNPDAGPSATYQWYGVLDPRFLYTKDKVTGWPGSVAAEFALPLIRSVSTIPAAISTNSIAAAQNVALGVPMTLALAASQLGVATQIPYRPFTGIVPGGTPTVAAIALEFGFDFCTTVAGNTTVTVGAAGNYSIGMPLVIAQVGNAAGTAALLTNVVSVNTVAGTIVIANAPGASLVGTEVGTGDLWGPTEVPQGYPAPLAHAPWQAAGPGLFFDPRQACVRGVSITGSAGSAGGAVLIAGADVFGVPMTQLLTVGAGAVTANSLKTFKYIFSVTPQFSDAHNYSIGTTDTFGMNIRTNLWDDVQVTWAGVLMTTSNGFTAPVGTSPATNLTGDVRATVLITSIGGASNGVLSGLVMTGRRLHLTSQVSLNTMVTTTQANTVPLYGVLQA